MPTKHVSVSTESIVEVDFTAFARSQGESAGLLNLL